MVKLFGLMNKKAYLKIIIMTFGGSLAIWYLIFLILQVGIRGYPLIPDTTSVIYFTSILGMVMIFIIGLIKSSRYAVSDYEFAYCISSKQGMTYIKVMSWKDVLRLEYRNASLLTGFFNQLTVYSISGVKIHIHDGYKDFSELVEIVCEKTGMEPEIKSWRKR